jgi:hypothetical protein
VQQIVSSRHRGGEAPDSPRPDATAPEAARILRDSNFDLQFAHWCNPQASPESDLNQKQSACLGRAAQSSAISRRRIFAKANMTPLRPTSPMHPSRSASSPRQPGVPSSLGAGVDSSWSRNMRSTTPSAASAAAAATEGVLLRIRSLLTRPIRLERRGIDWHFVMDPPQRAAGQQPPPQLGAPPSAQRRNALYSMTSMAPMPSMTSEQVGEVCANLRAVLGGEVGHHPRLPSLALLERALMKDGVRGIDNVPAAVLRHAAQTLDEIELDKYGPGLVVLRRRVEQVLRRRHGDRHTHQQLMQQIERAAPPLAADGMREFSDSLTEFIDLDKMFAGSDR